MIQFEDVSKVFPSGISALRHVSFRIDPAEFVFVVGANGSGKSTLLRLIYRDERPTSGRVLVYRHDIDRLRGRGVAILRRRLGVVFQDFKLLATRSVYDNVAVALRIHECSPEEIRSRTLRALDLVGLEHRAAALPAELSVSEQQRVSVARALVTAPPLLLADEPTGTLDANSGRELMQVLAQLHQGGTTVVVATHNTPIVEHFRRRVIQLADGRLVRDQVGALNLVEA